MGRDTGGKIGAGRRAAIYARAPSPSDCERISIEEQLEACRSLAAELGFIVTTDAVFTDVGPGTGLGRPGLTALLRAIAQGDVEALVVYTLDRLARADSKPLEALLKELRRRELPIYLGKTPKGYQYDPATGTLVADPDVGATANLEEWRPPEELIIPREDDRDW